MSTVAYLTAGCPKSSKLENKARHCCLLSIPMCNSFLPVDMSARFTTWTIQLTPPTQLDLSTFTRPCCVKL